MSAAAWVRTARPEAPPALLARVESVLASNPAWDALEVPEALTEAAVSLLRVVLRDEPAGAGDRATDRARDRALDLLAADACVTWAFEAAADAPDRLLARTGLAMDRLAGVTA